MNQRSVNLGGSLIANHQAAVVLKPGIRSLDDPSAAIPTQHSAVLMGRDRVIGPGGDDRLNPAIGQSLSDEVAVISPIRHQTFRGLPRTARLMGVSHPDRFQSGQKQLHLRRGRRVHVKSERSTLAINQYHELCSLAPLGLSDFRPPFFALAKVPSTKHPFQRICPFSFNWARKARHIFSKMPALVHCCNRRWTVLLVPYREGNSLHGAPVQRIHRIPSKHFRSSAGGRPPLRSFLRQGFLRTGRCSRTFSHCSSVRLLQAMSPTLLSRGVGDYHKTITSVPYRRFGDDL